MQPAVKCRGREYLRIIYGPEYTFPENLSRLRQRGLATKRPLALREFALGIEGLERFVASGAAAPCPRVRLRRAGPGERAGRSEIVDCPQLWPGGPPTNDLLISPLGHEGCPHRSDRRGARLATAARSV